MEDFEDFRVKSPLIDVDGNNISAFVGAKEGITKKSSFEVLEKEFPNIPIHPQDERNTTVEAAAIFHQNGLNSKKQRKKIDSGAAMVILERYLKGLGQL